MSSKYRTFISFLLIILCSPWVNARDYKVLCLGNSYTDDMTALVSLLASNCQSEAINDVTVYRAARGSGSIKNWLDVYNGTDNSSYVLSKVIGPSVDGIPAGRIKGTEYNTIHFMIDSVQWDAIIIHQVSTYATDYDRWMGRDNAGYLDVWLDTLRARQPQARIGFALVHSKLSSITQHEMWQQIANSVQQLEQSGLIDFVVPYGTAVENVRQTHYNDSTGITRDGQHLGYGLARYTAACCFYQSVIAPITGESILRNKARHMCSGTVKYPESSIDVMADEAWLAQRAAVIATKYPYRCINPLPMGDVNTDNRVNVGDITTIASVIMGDAEQDDYPLSDVNLDDRINTADITTVASIIMGNDLTPRDTLNWHYATADLMADTLRVLFIGDITMNETVEMLPSIATAAGCDLSTVALYKLIVTYQYKNYSYFDTWFSTYTGQNTSFSYSFNNVLGEAPIMGPETGAYTGPSIMRAIIEGGPWDLIVIQYFQGSAISYKTMFNSNLLPWLNVLHACQPQAEIDYLLEHAYSYSYARNYKKSSLEYWKLLVDVAQQMEQLHGLGIIPTGTAVENLRASSLNTDNDLTYYGYLLADGLAKFTANGLVYEQILAPRTGVSINDVDFSYTVGSYWRNKNGDNCIDVNDTTIIPARKAIISALQSPYTVVNPDSIE